MFAEKVGKSSCDVEGSIATQEDQDMPGRVGWSWGPTLEMEWD